MTLTACGLGEQVALGKCKTAVDRALPGALEAGPFDGQAFGNGGGQYLISLASQTDGDLVYVCRFLGNELIQLTRSGEDLLYLIPEDERVLD